MIQATGENEGEFIEQKNSQIKNELNTVCSVRGKFYECKVRP
jgi:hypothetical protein